MTAPVIDLDTERLLADAAEAGPNPGTGRLRELAVALRGAAAGLDAAALRSSLSEGEPRLMLARDPHGPALGLRWMGPGEVTTVHHHAWTVILQLDGESAFERWTVAGAADAGAAAGSVAELSESLRVGAGDL